MTRARSVAIVALACLAVGAAGWASRAVLDELIVDGVRQRIALVPSWYPMLSFSLLGLLAVCALGYVAAQSRRHDGTDRVGVAHLVLPAFALAALVVPYVPGPPDWWPALQAIAGPGRWIVWGVVAGQFAWVLWPHARRFRAWLARRSLRSLTIAVWLATAAAGAVGAARLTHTVLFPSGDEPHYLVLAQSLWRDGDLLIENNHRRGDYREYFGRDLDPHYLTRGVDQQIYSIHPIGMPVLITPVFALGGYDLVVALFVAMAATAAAVAWRWVVATTGALGPPTLAWAAIAFSAPFLVNTFTIYPEVPAALAVTLAVAVTLRPIPDSRPWHGWAIGALAAMLPWFSTKYAPMSGAIVAVAIARRWWPMHPAEARGSWIGSALPIAAPYAISVLGWFAFFYAYWGTPWPHGPYGSMSQTELRYTLFGVPGLLFDQEYGLLAYAPAYVLAGFGLWRMTRRAGPMRRLGLEVAVVFTALLMTVGAFRIWWGGSAAPGRPLMSGLLLLMLPMAVQIGSARAASARRAAQHLLVAVGAALAIVLLVAQDGFLLNNDRDGTSSLLEWLSPRWPLWNVLPTFVAHEARRALADVAVWLLAIAAGSWALGRVRASSRGGASLAALTAGAIVLVAGAVGMRVLPAADPPLPAIDLRARARLAALDSFDHVSRPIAVRYRSVRFDAATGVEPMLFLSVRDGLRPEPQPLRVLHNGRFSLPAGRYRAVVQWAARDPLPAPAGTPLELQVGRIGPPFQRWLVSPRPGATWQQEFWLPVDAGFVGFRGAPELERSIEELRIEAVDVIDAGERVSTPQVLAAASYGDAVVMFHDEHMYPESRGFWTRAGRGARLTIGCEGGCVHGVTLRMHSGKVANRLSLSTLGWRQDVDLLPETQVVVRIPPPADGTAIELVTSTATGFVPIEVDPAVRDRRSLGVWIEVAPSAEERP